MKFLHNLFFKTKMTWPRVILFAVITAVVTAAVLIIPATASTSLANIGVTLECWILFALIIIMNCKKPLEAGAKTFVFFLISQPLIYLLQVPFYFDGFGIFRYYRWWFILTLATFPGGIIAWYVKKDNILSAVILSVATSLLVVQGMDFIGSCMNSFPKNLGSAVFCFVLAIVLILVLLRKKSGRLTAFGITLIATIIAAIFTFSAHTSFYNYDLPGGEGWTISEIEGSIGDITVNDEGSSLLINADEFGTEELTLVNEAGETQKMTVTYDRKSGVQVIEE